MLGPDDELGTVNFITAESVLRGVQAVRTGQVLSLAIPFDADGPQTGTQWDSLAPVVHDGKIYNGYSAADGHYDFLLSALPLTITGAAGSPINPMAAALRCWPPPYRQRGRDL